MTESPMKHTPTPWGLDGGCITATPNPVPFSNYLILESAFREDAFCKDPQALANAKFIVRACNAHDELIKALTEIRQELWVDYCLGAGRTDIPDDAFKARPVIRILDDALKMAKEPEK